MLQEAAAAALEAARSDAARVAKYLARLREVQARRAGMEAALAGNTDADPDPNPDPDGGASEASSAVSGLSAYTSHSFHTGRGGGKDPAGGPAGPPSSSSRASAPPSTVGGRRARRDRNKPARAGRIRQGGAGEVRRTEGDAPLLHPSWGVPARVSWRWHEQGRRLPAAAMASCMGNDIQERGWR